MDATIGRMLLLRGIAAVSACVCASLAAEPVIDWGKVTPKLFGIFSRLFG